MSTNPSLIFNGKSMRNAIIQKLAEDHNLSSAMFSNSNITILVDIISYMYQSLMSNLRFAASESMFTDTVLFENATRLAKLIGYYSKGAYPYSVIAKIQDATTPSADIDTTILSDAFYTTTLTYGPYSFKMALVDDISANTDGNYVKLVLGEWGVTTYTAGGDKFEEFELPELADEDSYISQQYASVFVRSGETGEVKKWNYSETPVFATLHSVTDNKQQRLITKYDASGEYSSEWYRYNFYLDENNSYILKFGDGLSSGMPDPGDTIIVVYLTSDSTAATMTDDQIAALSNAVAGTVKVTSNWETINTALYPSTTNTITDPGLTVLPVTKLTGYKEVDTAKTITQNAGQAFNRQQRVVTKADYKSYLLENDSTVADCVVQNNWDFIATYYGYIYNLAKQVVINTTDVSTDTLGLSFIEQSVNRGFFTSLDAADANTIYLWTLSKANLGINDGWTGSSSSDNTFGLTNSITHTSELFDNVKNITEHVVDVRPIWRTYCPFVSVSSKASDYIKLDSMQNISGIDSSEELLTATATKINIYADLKYINSTARIKTSVNKLIKQYLYDDIKLGTTPNVSQLLKQILNITGVNSVTTVYDNKDSTDDTREVREVQGLQFLSWTAVEITDQPICFDTMLTYGLPQINQFEYLKCAIGYTDFISNFINIVPDYNRIK